MAQFGTLVTDFTLIKPGALHRANGGCLILDARKILGNPFAWFSVYAAAVFAYALCWIFPIVINVVYENRAEAQLRQLLRRQQNLVAEWGESVREEMPGQGGG